MITTVHMSLQLRCTKNPRMDPEKYGMYEQLSRDSSIKIHRCLTEWEQNFLVDGGYILKIGWYTIAHYHTCQVGKVQKREISLFASCRRGRFYAKPFRDINFVYHYSNSGWNFENDEIFLPYNGLKLFISCITFYHCTWWILYWLSNVFLLQNSIQFILFKEKMIGRKWGWKRGRFPFLGGRFVSRREMGSKRGSLPPKEGDLTCMHYTFITQFGGRHEFSGLNKSSCLPTNCAINCLLHVYQKLK